MLLLSDLKKNNIFTNRFIPG